MQREQTVGSERLAHLNDYEIDRYARSRSDAEEARAIEQHMAACAKCLQRIKNALRRVN